jgi:hypothetical protein
MPSVGRIEQTADGRTVAVIEPEELARKRQRDKNLAKARRVRIKQLRQTNRQRQREHKSARQAYKAACASYYRIRRAHGEGSEQEREAFLRMIRAEAEWFRTYPTGGPDDRMEGR